MIDLPKKLNIFEFVIVVWLPRRNWKNVTQKILMF